jgi:hypothetical protein
MVSGSLPRTAPLNYRDIRAEPLPALTAADMAAIEARKQDMEKLLKPENRPRYRLKFTLLGSPTFQNNPHWTGHISFLTSGREHSHGGNQVVLYMCPGWELRKNGCSSLLPPEGNKGGTCVCPACGNVWKGEEVWQYCQGRLTPKQWAKRIAHHLQKRLSGSADIEVYCHIQTKGLHEATVLEQQKVYNGDLLAKVEGQDFSRVYRHEDITRDLLAGSLLVDRVYAFLKSL